MIKTAHLHFFELQQKIHDSPQDPTLLLELEKHLAECVECRENSMLYHNLQYAAHIRFPIPSEKMLTDSQMITVVKQRFHQKLLLNRLFSPFPGLAWITLTIMMVFFLIWGIAYLRKEPNLTPLTSVRPVTPSPTPIEVNQVLKGCRSIFYTVEEKNTLLAIADYFNVEISDIWKENNLRNDTALKPGIRLLIPFCGWSPVLYTYDLSLVTPINDCPVVQYTVQQGETLEMLSIFFNVPVSTIITDNQLENSPVLSPGDILAISLCKSP